nr:MAG TPA: hypothetical protein [Caudoviricetes sp.]
MHKVLARQPYNSKFLRLKIRHNNSNSHGIPF